MENWWELVTLWKGRDSLDAEQLEQISETYIVYMCIIVHNKRTRGGHGLSGDFGCTKTSLRIGMKEEEK